MRTWPTCGWVASELITNAVGTERRRPSTGGLVAVKVAAVGAEMAYVEVIDGGAAPSLGR